MGREGFMNLHFYTSKVAVYVLAYVVRSTWSTEYLSTATARRRSRSAERDAMETRAARKLGRDGALGRRRRRLVGGGSAQTRLSARSSAPGDSGRSTASPATRAHAEEAQPSCVCCEPIHCWFGEQLVDRNAQRQLRAVNTRARSLHGPRPRAKQHRERQQRARGHRDPHRAPR